MTHHIAATLGLLALTSCSMAQHSKSRASDLREAFLQHQKLELPEIKATYALAGGESYVMAQRWKNYQLYSESCPSLGEVVSVTISKTMDTNSFVITLMGPHSGEVDKNGYDLDRCSLWMVGGKENVPLDVRSFTPY